MRLKHKAYEKVSLKSLEYISKEETFYIFVSSICSIKKYRFQSFFYIIIACNNHQRNYEHKSDGHDKKYQ